jgi:hypothetical protein
VSINAKLAGLAPPNDPRDGNDYIAGLSPLSGSTSFAPEHLLEHEQLDMKEGPSWKTELQMDASQSREDNTYTDVSAQSELLQNGTTSHIEAEGSQAGAGNTSSQIIFRDLAEDLGQFLQLQDETTRMRVHLQQLREAASRAHTELEVHSARLQQTVSQQIHPREYKSMTSKHRTAEIRLQDAEQACKDVDFRLVFQESQLKTHGERLRQALLKHSGVPLTSRPISPGLPTVHRVSSNLDDTRSHRSTEFSFFSATGPAKSSIYDPDAPGFPEVLTLEERGIQKGSIDDYAPDLLAENEWTPELYVIKPAANDDELGTNADEYLDPAVNDFLSDKMPLTTFRLGHHFGKQRPGLHWVRWMLHMKELRQTAQDMLDSQPPDLEVLKTAFAWQAEIRAYAAEMDPSTAGTGVPSCAPSERGRLAYTNMMITGLPLRPSRPVR